MLKPVITTLFAIFGISTIVSAQSRLAQEVGIILGPVEFQSDYGQRNNFDTNVGNVGFGVGVVHFLNFSSNNNRENYFTEHFKERSELSFNTTKLEHFGKYVEREKVKNLVEHLRAMHGTSTLVNLGAQLEYSPFMSIHAFEKTVGGVSPYVSLGFQVSYYSTKVESRLGTLGLPQTTYPKYLTPSDGHPYGFSSESGVVASVTAGVGIHYKLTEMSDLMFEARYQGFSSDWVDGLNPNKDLYKENKSNDSQVWFNVGYIMYLEY
ncbi:glutamate dehydrogenase [uncultured Flavobacterium sp.]|uniref:THC0290_0291 family protein n=1 Tax=uncultured Flavobacterium sp. TaxID=165435 RepID=UPI00292DBD69|nr:glutamate dehydrogenase [uncultured Flavobacterium sp.]